MDLTIGQNIQFHQLRPQNKINNIHRIKESRILSLSTLISIFPQNLVLPDSLPTVAPPEIWLPTFVPSHRQLRRDFPALRHFQKSRLAPDPRS